MIGPVVSGSATRTTNESSRPAVSLSAPSTKRGSESAPENAADVRSTAPPDHAHWLDGVMRASAVVIRSEWQAASTVGTSNTAEYLMSDSSHAASLPSVPVAAQRIALKLRPAAAAIKANPSLSSGRRGPTASSAG